MSLLGPIGWTISHRLGQPMGLYLFLLQSTALWSAPRVHPQQAFLNRYKYLFIHFLWFYTYHPIREPNKKKKLMQAFALEKHKKIQPKHEF